MQIVLSILQFIGIALLVLLGILLFLILLILFYPICYTIEGELYGEKTVKARVSWLFHLIRAKVVYEDDLISAKVGIFWKNIPFSYEFATKTETEDETENEWDIDISADTDEKDEKLQEEIIQENDEIKDLDVECDTVKSDFDRCDILEEDNVSHEILQESLETMENRSISKEFNTEPKNNDRNLSDVSECETEDTILKSDEDSISESQKENGFNDTNLEEDVTFSEEKSEKETTASNDSSDSNTSDETKRSFIEKIKGMVSKIKGTINKIKQVWGEIKTILTDKQNKSAVKHIKDEGIYLLKIFLPVKSKVNGVFSTGSPDTTGKVFGVIAAFPFMYQNEWSLRPDFTAENAYFEGVFYAKGRIYLYKMVFAVLRILFDKNCRRLYKMIKRFIHKVKGI